MTVRNGDLYLFSAHSAVKKIPGKKKRVCSERVVSNAKKKITARNAQPNPRKREKIGLEQFQLQSKCNKQSASLDFAKEIREEDEQEGVVDKGRVV